MAGKARLQEQEAAGHIAVRVRKQSERNVGTKRTFSLLAVVILQSMQ